MVTAILSGTSLLRMEVVFLTALIGKQVTPENIAGISVKYGSYDSVLTSNQAKELLLSTFKDYIVVRCECIDGTYKATLVSPQGKMKDCTFCTA